MADWPSAFSSATTSLPRSDCASASEKPRPTLSGPNVDSARVDPIAAAFRRFALGAVLQFPGTGVVRISLFLLVPAGMGTDQFPTDLAGISTAYPGRSSINSAIQVAGMH